VANKIAAGEVVERPASVIKELLENALDAGAQEVRIDAENAGRRLLRIQDDGSGMLRDDALLAFERHATSKLSDVKDLLAIATLGFRGEALPSIASVSRLLLETRSDDEQTGTAVEIQGGKLVRCDEIARTRGTTITVRDLFFNIPARKKFLRSDQTELAHIGSLVTHYSLGHPEKRFELYHEGRELLAVTPVSSVRDRAFQVFGSDIISELIAIGPAQFTLDETQPVGFLVEGLVSGPHVQKLNRNSIFLFVNGRLIRDKVLLHAVQSAYHNLMPPGCYPFALLFLRCDPGEVDVNVHPAKTEVRFRHSTPVHDFVRDAVRAALMESRPVSAMPVLPESPSFAAPVRSLTFPTAPVQQAAALPFSEFTSLLHGFDERGAPPEGNSPTAQELNAPEIRLPSPPEHRTTPVVTPLAQPSATRRVPDTHGALQHLGPDWERADSLTALPDLRPLGQLHDSFIVAAGRDGLWIIDQHVAHERILFEQVLKQRASGNVEVQQLLMPMLVQLTPGQQLEYARISDELGAHGFECEPFGNRTLAIRAAPAAVGASDIEKVVCEILEIAETELRSAPPLPAGQR
jgi:DNA mismatch repair protein MutL